MQIKAFRKISPLIFVSAIVLILAAVSYLRVLENYELGSLDLRFKLRPIKNPVTDKVVIVEIGKDSIDKLGRFPFDRSYHAILVKALSDAGAKAILFDLLFSEPHEHDSELEAAIHSASNVYLPYAFDTSISQDSNVIYAHTYLAKCLERFNVPAKGTGQINIIPDPDGKFRRVPLFVRHENTLHPYLSFLMSCDYLGIPREQVKLVPGKYISLGKDLRIPLDDKSNMMVNFSGRWGTVFRHYSFVDIMQSYLASITGGKPILNLADFKGKVCIIGLTAPGTCDTHPVPFETLYPGVGIHAEVFNSLLNKKFIMRASKGINLTILAILSILISVTTLKLKPIKSLLALIAAICLFVIISIFLFSYFCLWIDMICPIFIMAVVYLAMMLYRYVAEWKKRAVFENELGIAKSIQESFLPKSLPAVTGVDVAVMMSTARHVGGDLYDFVEMGNGKLGIMIGDVSGKGVPASLFMAMATGAFRSFAAPGHEPQEVLSSLNLKLIRESVSNLFITAFYAIFDITNRAVVYSNGGHLPVLHLAKDGSVKFLDVDEGAPLGLIEGAYSQRDIKFAPGDIFVFYTDGITEAMNPKGEFYGTERLEAAIKKNKGLDAKGILAAIEKDVRIFEPKAKQHDDMTLIVIKAVVN